MGLVGTLLVTKRLRTNMHRQSSSPSTLADESKELIRNRINTLESLDEKDLEDLIKLIRMINSHKQDSTASNMDGYARTMVKDILGGE